MGTKIKKVVKRDGSIVDFNSGKIVQAIGNAFDSSGEHCIDTVNDLYGQIMNELHKLKKEEYYSVEDIQDVVENVLMKKGYYKTAKLFIKYREQHKENRLLGERLSYMTSYIDSSNNAASSSEEDSNANVTIKNVANLNSEVYKNLNRRLQRMWMKNKLKELYPDSDIYKQYEKDLNHHIIYSHDEASFSVPTNYCEAVTLYPLLLEGTSTMDGLKTVPPKNLNSFCGQLVNLTFLLAAQCKGAVAFGEFFNFLDYFCVKEWGENYTEILDEIVYSDICNSKKTVKQVILQAFQNIVYSWNQPAGNRGFQSPFINISYYDSNYWKALFEDFCFPDGSKPKWERVDVLQKLFMKWFNAERKKTLMTFPVETMALLTDGKDVIDKDYKNFTAEMWSEGHSFFLYLSDNPDGLSSCCRLKNKIGENEFSFTNGLSGVKTGSCNVITLNLNRIIQDWAKQSAKSLEENNNILDKTVNMPGLTGFKEYLIDILERVYKYQIAYKTILYEEEEKGMLTASKAGYISMKDLFSTIGINGINEAAEFIGLKCSYNNDYKDFCRLITGTISEQNKLHSTPLFKFNQEFVPAEQLGSRNYNWDREDGYWVPKNRVLYNSYFYLADDKNTTILDKFRLHGKEFTELCDGGMGLHCNLEEHLSKEQYLKLIDFAISQGTFYFTFNVPNSECLDCGNIEKIPVEKCPKCGSTHITQWTRIIGYLRPIRCFDKYRQIEAKTRIYSNGKEEIKC